MLQAKIPIGKKYCIIYIHNLTARYQLFNDLLLTTPEQQANVEKLGGLFVAKKRFQDSSSPAFLHRRFLQTG
jgi:hypothetical protein